MVEYNPTFLSIKNLFNDEISNMALSFMQIRNNKHPLFEKTKQRSLSEITQMIYLIRMLHKGIFEFEDKTFDKSIIMGNNLAIISEDYLLACVHRGLAKLEVFEMNNAIADLMVLDFTEYGNIHNLNINFIKDKKFNNLLAHSSFSTLILVNHPTNLKNLAFDLGNQLGTAFEFDIEY
ncbi:all trans-polyprenyl-diphosphate synthase PDSS2-like [Gordionus sp. m RMFG-2023]|uniref:all trans-polyprenyl-diphosphate synthase PDSS2-like n=1 Tax=Gordionus sp. m RMFG-2023 TaxID=3053472 RepID=UPI0031FD8B6F